MSRNNISDRRAGGGGVDLAGAEFASFTAEEADDDRILRSSLWVAVGFHVLLLMINFPAFSDRAAAAEPPAKKVFVVETVRFEPPPPDRTLIPPRRVARVPVPDPTPSDPEPFRVDEPRHEILLPDPEPDFVIPEAPPEPEPDHPIEVGGDVRKPEKLHAVQPRYTEIARKTRTEGDVIVRAIIDRRGEVTDVKVLKGLPMGLTEEAVQAVRQWKFEPATLRGKPVDVYFELTIRFRLQ